MFWDFRYGSQEVHPVFYIVVIAENQKHPSSPECLVSAQKVLEGSELELAKVLMEYPTGEAEQGWSDGTRGTLQGLLLTQGEMMGALFLGL